MKPNLYFYFNDITCDLSRHRFYLLKNKNNEQKNIQRCKYTNSNKILIIFQGDFIMEILMVIIILR